MRAIDVERTGGELNYSLALVSEGQRNTSDNNQSLVEQTDDVMTAVGELFGVTSSGVLYLSASETPERYERTRYSLAVWATLNSDGTTLSSERILCTVHIQRMNGSTKTSASRTAARPSLVVMLGWKDTVFSVIATIIGVLALTLFAVSLLAWFKCSRNHAANSKSKRNHHHHHHEFSSSSSSTATANPPSSSATSPGSSFKIGSPHLVGATGGNVTVLTASHVCVTSRSSGSSSDSGSTRDNGNGIFYVHAAAAANKGLRVLDDNENDADSLDSTSHNKKHNPPPQVKHDATYWYKKNTDKNVLTI